MGRLTQRWRVTRYGSQGTRSEGPDLLAVEEPLEIRVGGVPYATTMRTPGHDIELAHGFLHAEGVIGGRDDVSTARYCAGAVTLPGRRETQNTYNVLDLDLTAGVDLPTRHRAREVTSACGVCGTDTIDALRVRGCHDLTADRAAVSATVLTRLPDVLREHQAVFAQTAGVHAAGLFTPSGDLRCVREDVGRHNAVDKVIGWALLADADVSGSVLQVSGRASFELVQKAYLAGIPILSAVSAPSSLAAETADSLGLTLVGFVRGGSLVVYTHADRIVG